MREVSMDIVKKAMLNNMIQHETFYGVPIELVNNEMIDLMDQDQLQTFWIVATMLQFEAIDEIVATDYPYEAEYLLSKFTINPT